MIYLAALTIAACLWAAAITDRLSSTRVRHARYASRPRWQVRADGKHRIGQGGTPAPTRAETEVRVTAADWPPAPAAVAG